MFRQIVLRWRVGKHLAGSVFLYAVQEQLLMLGLLGCHAGGPNKTQISRQHYLVPLCHHQLTRPYPLHLPAAVDTLPLAAVGELAATTLPCTQI